VEIWWRSGGDLVEIWWRSGGDLVGSAAPLGCVEQPSARWLRLRGQGCGAAALPRGSLATSTGRRHRHQLGREALKVVTEDEEAAEHEGGAVEGGPCSRVELGELRSRE
jgi:hypothetical protein